MAQINDKVSNGVKPRVLIFSVAYEPWVGGAELAVRSITDRLFNYEFDLITCQLRPGPSRKEHVGNVEVHRVGFGGKLGKYLYPFFAARLAAKLHRRAPYKLVWSIMAAYAGGAALLFLRKQQDIKFLLTLQEGDSLAHIHERVRYFLPQWRRIFGRADYVQAISKFLAEWAKREGVQSPVEVVPNGVDLRSLSLSKEKKSPSDKIIITTSRLVEKNGLDVLLRAFAELKKRGFGGKLSLQILGSGPLEGRLKLLAVELGVSGSVEFYGHIEPAALPKYLYNADVFVRPSRSEGLGSSFLEAMAAGLPVVATPVGGIPDFLSDGKTGLFSRVDDPVDLAEKIKRVLDDPKLSARLAANAKQLVQARYDWELVSKSMDRIFSKLVQKTP
ncbi:MAG: hypothetical protein A3K06_00950 [Candidatus Doudnabacteria bacterium RIFCSPHIGHO2_01_52_17]|uniref:Glycosyl transferase family 1 domain-containing protein n=1 Tax=Candidatus Doudnabacteria bacterium RIFCSPHIGHO2_01_52_17 TaxID=1817820 RepID=A0A1F5NEW5_9BACT|nr:MAG: Glycosyltransferase [Parcubacteria group bacterium GW2011_GWA2_52_8]OGE76128.1 MAG: hypothetical protein A3K06_00950 [Candidatus Doudnabacteria bacterium RIFCSPHIGHO2_01_52_17]